MLIVSRLGWIRHDLKAGSLRLPCSSVTPGVWVGLQDHHIVVPLQRNATLNPWLLLVLTVRVIELDGCVPIWIKWDIALIVILKLSD